MKKWAGVIILMVALGWLGLTSASAALLSDAQARQTSTVARVNVLAPTMNILRVDDDSSAGTPDGSSWALAYPNLQDALAVATSGDEIWVAKGVYYPDTGAMQTPNSVTATFQLTDSLAIYGGFAATETLRTQRDWQANITVLSGDIDHDVMGNEDTNKDANDIIPATSDIVGNNAYHVATGSGTDSTALLDGFTINAGKADDGSFSCPNNCGGGMYNDSGTPTLINVTITANSARNGGGMYNNNSSNPTLTNVTITANSARNGGGIYNNNSSNPTLTNVAITTNSARNGGGIYNETSHPVLTNVIISTNFASQSRMRMYNENSSNQKFTNVVMSTNSASLGASYSGGGIYNDSSKPTLTNVTITANSASDFGGGIYNDSSNLTLTNVTITANSANRGGGMLNFSNNPTLTNVTITANSANAGGGMLNFSSKPTLTNVTITANSAQLGGGMYNQDSSIPTLINVVIWNNKDQNGVVPES